MPQEITNALAKDFEPKWNPKTGKWQNTKVYDTEIPGFGMRYQRNGKRVYFFLRYRSPTESDDNGKPSERYKTLGRYTGGKSLFWARTKAQAYLSRIDDGEDPVPNPEAINEKTNVNTFIKLYFDDKIVPRGKHNTIRAAERFLFEIDYRRDYVRDSGGNYKVVRKVVREGAEAHNGEIARKLGKLQIGRVTRKEIYDLFEYTLQNRRTKTGAESVAAANLCYDICKAMFNYAIRRHNLQIISPCRLDTNDRRTKEIKPRKKILKDEQYKAIRSSLDRYRDRGGIATNAANCIILMTMTGVRHNEARKLTWDQVDLDNGVLNLIATKTGDSDRVLNDEARKFLKSLPRVEGNPYVFPGRIEGKPVGDLFGPWDTVRTKAGQPTLRLHDLRHAFFSRLGLMGAPPQFIQKLGGWASAQHMQRYVNISETDALRDVANLASR